MGKFVEMIDYDGEPIDIPAGALTFFEGLKKGENPNLPEAQVWVSFKLGAEPLAREFMQSTFSDIVMQLGLTTIDPASHPWLIVTLDNGNRAAVLVHNVVARRGAKADDYASQITVTMDEQGHVRVFNVKESHAEIRAKMEACMPDVPSAMMPMVAEQLAAANEDSQPVDANSEQEAKAPPQPRARRTRKET